MWWSLQRDVEGLNASCRRKVPDVPFTERSAAVQTVSDDWSLSTNECLTCRSADLKRSKAGFHPQLNDKTETKLKPRIRLDCVWNCRGLLFWKKDTHRKWLMQELHHSRTFTVVFPAKVSSRLQVRTILLTYWELSQQCFANCSYTIFGPVCM